MKTSSLLIVLALLVLSATFTAAEEPGRLPQSATLNAAYAKAISDLGSDLDKLNRSHQNLIKSVSELSGLYLKLEESTKKVAALAAGLEKGQTSGKTGELLKAVREMNKMQTGFNMQYLGLQQQMQDENRRFSLISNIMKNKHDTAKNSISNIR